MGSRLRLPIQDLAVQHVVLVESVFDETRCHMTLPIELEQEDDGRWFGVVDELPGVMAYGATRYEAATAALAFWPTAFNMEDNKCAAFA